MEIYERIFKLLGSEKNRQLEMANAIGISNKTISAWKTRGSDPSAKYISAIADFLEVSTEYLLTGEETKKSPSSPQLNEDESELLNQFKKLDKEGQTSVLHTCYQEIRRMREEQAATTAVSKNVG